MVANIFIVGPGIIESLAVRFRIRFVSIAREMFALSNVITSSAIRTTEFRVVFFLSIRGAFVRRNRNGVAAIHPADIIFSDILRQDII